MVDLGVKEMAKLPAVPGKSTCRMIGRGTVTVSGLEDYVTPRGGTPIHRWRIKGTSRCYRFTNVL